MWCKHAACENWERIPLFVTKMYPFLLPAVGSVMVFEASCSLRLWRVCVLFLWLSSSLFTQGNVKDFQLWVISKRDNAPYPLIGQWAPARLVLTKYHHFLLSCGMNVSWKGLRSSALSLDRGVRCCFRHTSTIHTPRRVWRVMLLLLGMNQG